MGKTLINRKHVYVRVGDYTWRMRFWRVRHNRRPRNVYMQVGPLELIVWYR